jgi:hypothetical protein
LCYNKSNSAQANLTTLYWPIVKSSSKLTQPQ